MAQVLAPMQPSGSMTMLHAPQDVFVAGSAGQSHNSPSRSSQIPKNHIYSQIGSVGYRGASSAPVTPYAFQSTPNLRVDLNKGLPSEPTGQSVAGNRLMPSAFRLSASASSGEYLTKDDSNINHAGRRHSDFSERPASSVDLSSSSKQEFATVPDGQAKPGPERYRRRRSDNNLQPSTGQRLDRSVSPASSAERVVDSTVKAPAYVHQRTSSADDSQYVRINTGELAKRYRRRSVASLENLSPKVAESASVHQQNLATSVAGSLPKSDASPILVAPPQAAHAVHRRTASGESNSSRTSQRPSVSFVESGY